MNIALAGNPNSGKTTLFNALTGSNQFVGKWPGVTVEKKEGRLKGHKDVVVVDLPGIYSLSPYTLEEVVTREFLLLGEVDVILNIVDGTNLERNLYLTSQLLDMGIPMVLAVNMMDLVEKNGDKLDIGLLSKALGCPVVEISALKGRGVMDAAKKAIEEAGRKAAPSPMVLDSPLEKRIQEVEALMDPSSKKIGRFLAIKYLEGDAKILQGASIDAKALSPVVEALEKEMDDDVESIIANARYQAIAKMIQKAISRSRKHSMTLSDKIDRIVTNRFLALPIFAAVMVAVYYVAVTTVGTWLTDWANDGVFGEGFSLFGMDIPGVPVVVGGWLEAVGASEAVSGLVLDGIVGGVGAVLGFVPQMLVLFAFLAFLEGCGYMARVAFIMDRIFRRFGLSGKSFIPMLIGSGCSVPAIMASRTIESDRDRKMTIMTTSFIPCGAKLPVIALISGALFGEAWWVAPSTYFIGVAAVICSGIFLKKTSLFAGDVAPFVMELPAYHMPTLGNVLRSMWERGWSFIKKAGSIILLSSIVVWFFSSFGVVEGQFRMLEPLEMDSSILAAIGNLFSWLFIPLGFGDWKSAVAAILGLVAKENVVSTFGILYGFEEVAEDGAEIWNNLAQAMTPVAAYSFLVFNLLCAPCFAAMGAIKREMNSAKWFWTAVGYQTVLAYLSSIAVYQIGSWITGGVFGFGTVLGFAVVAFMLYLLFRPAGSGAAKLRLRGTAGAIGK